VVTCDFVIYYWLNSLSLFFSCQSSGYEVYILEAPYKDPVVGLYITC
jgi:hypothetical protein